MESFHIKRLFYCILAICMDLLWNLWNLWLSSEIIGNRIRHITSSKIPLFICLPIRESCFVECSIILWWQANYLPRLQTFWRQCFPEEYDPEEKSMISIKTCCSLANQDHSVLATCFCYLWFTNFCKISALGEITRN